MCRIAFVSMCLAIDNESCAINVFFLLRLGSKSALSEIDFVKTKSQTDGQTNESHEWDVDAYRFLTEKCFPRLISLAFGRTLDRWTDGRIKG